VKHLLLLMVFVLTLYVAWHFSDEESRKEATKAIGRHFWRIGAMILLILLLIWTAAQLPATQLI